MSRIVVGDGCSANHGYPIAWQSVTGTFVGVSRFTRASGIGGSVPFLVEAETLYVRVDGYAG